MKIGDTVMVRAVVKDSREVVHYEISHEFRSATKSIYRVEFGSPFKAMFLGWSTKQTGDIRWNGYEEGYALVNRKSVRVAMVQPLESEYKTGRWVYPQKMVTYRTVYTTQYRRAVAVLPDDLELSTTQ
ncbi:hypothetical protein Rctr71_053 [Virus Rctr71]|nr:hypothetical protein Rctr71_053 [Virus Rctr71]